MTVPELRTEIRAIAAQQKDLVVHIAALATAREVALREGDLALVQRIEHGGAAAMTSNLPGLAEGLGGLRESEKEQALLAERRRLLEKELPTAAHVEAATSTARKNAAEIVKKLAALDATRPALQTAVQELARLALAEVDARAALSRERVALVQFCAECDIGLPPTPMIEAVLIPGAQPLAQLLLVAFATGSGRPVSIPAAMRRELVTHGVS